MLLISLARKIRRSQERQFSPVQEIELLRQQPRALPASGERREECERVDDTYPTNAVGERG